MPQCVAGKRTEPPMSVPTCSGAYPAAAAAPAPELEPEVLRVVFHGLRVMPCMLDSPEDSIPKSGIVVLPRITQPASRTRAAGGASAAAGTSSVAAVPSGDGTPAVATFSLIVMGTPSSALRGSPAVQRAAEAAASPRAPSAP